MHGPHPKDRELFAEKQLGRLREAAADYRYLLGRSYAVPSSLKLVGDRFQLTGRQRQFLFRAVCAPEAAAAVRARLLPAEAVRGADLVIDGHNVLITTETALAGGLCMVGDDGAMRDIAEKHGSYRQSEHTERALELLRDGLRELGPAAVGCFLDRPVPFSGLLARRMREAIGDGVAVEVVGTADRHLKERARSDPDSIVATGDSAVLAAVPRSFDLVRFLVERWIPEAWVVRL